MNILQKVLDIAKKKDVFTTTSIVKDFGISRQYASRIIKSLVDDGSLVKVGSTKNALYIHKANLQDKEQVSSLEYSQVYRAKSLEEHAVLTKIEKDFPLISLLPENIKSIFDFAFSEILNNAIEHSQTNLIHVTITKTQKTISFTISDAGVGVFRNILNKKHLRSELEAIQELLKGKATTMPRSHSGEGIFFTSKTVDYFVLESFGKRLIIDSSIPDTFIEDTGKSKRGTTVICTISMHSKRHLSDIFRQYTNLTEESDYGFDKTEIQVKLYSLGGVYISRSQARRILSGLEKFSIVVFDFDKVPVAGQAFTDEIFRVFHTKYPAIKLETKNMCENVSFMVNRAINEAAKVDKK